MNLKYSWLIIFCLFLNLTLLGQVSPTEELRGVWISTAFNIDWPSSTIISSEEQQQEFVDLLDKHSANGINAVFVQIRPSGEVFYESEIEPWSHWLTGKQGKAPKPFYDPLKFMIDECHKRNMEFHAWFNPFRAVSNLARVNPVEWHVTRKHPDWFVTYNHKVSSKYLNPGVPAGRDYIIKVVMEVVNKYDIDGVHFDDYFYPGKSFNDNASYIKYNPNGLKKDDWRRENINSFIHALSDSINAAKPDVKFGVSPSGIWRNKTKDPDGSDTRGFASYDQQYADVVKWLRNSWIDYVAPQIYWVIGYKVADYKKLVDWWSRHVFGKHLYIGHGTHRINTSGAWQNPSEVPNQIRLNRQYPQVKGSIFYSSAKLLENRNGLVDTLRNDLFFAYADIPKMGWKQQVQEPNETLVPEQKPDNNSDTIKIEPVLPTPSAPVLVMSEKVGRETFIQWEMDKSEHKFLADTGSYYKVYRFRGKVAGRLSKSNLYVTTKQPLIVVSRRGLFKKKFTFVVTSVNSQGKESVASKSVIVKMKR